MINSNYEDGNYIYIVFAANQDGFSQPYSSLQKARDASKKLQSLRPEWNILIHTREIDDDNFWEMGCEGAEYAFRRRMSRCFDKELILIMYFSLLVFLWFKI